MGRVLDTNVVASALLWGGSPRQLLLAAHERRGNLHQRAAAGRIDRNSVAAQVRAKDRRLWIYGGSTGRSLCRVGRAGTPGRHAADGTGSR